MGTASKLSMLLTTPFPLFCSRPSVLRLTRHSSVSIASLSSSSKHKFSSNSRRLRLGFSIKASENIHTQTTSVVREDYHVDTLGFSSNSRVSHPWPEWSKLLENLSTSGYFDRQQSSDEFEDLSDEFVRAANACLSFACDRSYLLRLLSRKDIEVVLENGSPLLFKGAVDSERRLKSFLGRDGSNELEFEREGMVDLMRFLLSYACNSPTSSKHDYLNNRELVESSVRHLLSELADASRAVRESDLSGSMPKQFPDKYGQSPRPLGQNIEMKRGDWICSNRCSFMNFANNMKCLECDEARPKRQLTGGEWDCPQCDFFNYGRNVVCMRCDCKRPGEPTAGPRFGLGYSNEINQNKASQVDNASGFNRSIADDPEILPLRKGVNRFVVSTRKPPLERRLANGQYQGNLDNDSTTEGNGFQARDGVGLPKTSETSVSQSLDRILGRTSSVPEMNDGTVSAGENNSGIGKSSISSSASPPYRRSEGSNSNYVPFVPLPADMFAKLPKPEKDKQVMENKHDAVKATQQMGSSLSDKSGDSLLLSEKPVNQIESKEDKDQAVKSERWFKKVAELHDVTDLASAISDDDFPEIMPMRKGENRFVVSKKKDRSLTSPLYKRRMAMEQTNNTTLVPFVPFPPDYFAKKDKSLESSEPGASTEKANDGTSAASATPVIQGVPEKTEEPNAGFPKYGAASVSMQRPENQQASRNSWNTPSSTKSFNKCQLDGVYEGPSANSTQRPDDLLNNRERQTSGGSWKDSSSRSEAPPSPIRRSSTQEHPEKTQNSGVSLDRGFSGRSLEGSLVKEPDPLDMSEEAKAERWFRRAAQIKDISELSQIPDEDFPTIMPMRKGVNRFVVSKRKTPLERRLTSPQYRRNLPIVSSEPLKKEENDSS
ncbi:zinc finger protein [Macleaya cordata]|uniref:Zinc finger protein n=1 Tax=Macleaya cordata TaxID=56857 RepID=A0A200R8L0_MACCD|nr:zinc finger protein [Macleaya cordata]